MGDLRALRWRWPALGFVGLEDIGDLGELRFPGEPSWKPTSSSAFSTNWACTASASATSLSLAIVCQALVALGVAQEEAGYPIFPAHDESATPTI
jgi:hypothetical protein